VINDASDEAELAPSGKMPAEDSICLLPREQLAKKSEPNNDANRRLWKS
jgi:hypothetical protein